MAANMQGAAREKWYRDSVWQFVGVVIALVAIGVSVWLAFFWRNVKSVQVVVLAETSLVDIADAVAGEVQVTYQGRPIPNLTLVQVKVENNGTVEVRSADYEAPITLVFPEGAEVLNAQVLETKPADLGIGAEVKGREVVLTPKLMNPGDMAVLRLVLAGMPGTGPGVAIEATGRIAGVKEIPLVSALAEQSTGANGTLVYLVAFYIFIIVALVVLNIRPVRIPVGLSELVKDRTLVQRRSANRKLGRDQAKGPQDKGQG